MQVLQSYLFDLLSQTHAFIIRVIYHGFHGTHNAYVKSNFYSFFVL